jgi:hypothetical protein
MSRFDSSPLRLARAIKFAIELAPEDEPTIVGHFGFDNLSKADAQIVEALLEVASAFPSPKLKKEIDELKVSIAELHSEIAALRGENLLLQVEHERFMKACVCVTLSKEPNK